MTKSKVLEIIDRRISEQYEIIRKYQRGSAHERAQAAKEELFDLRMEIEKIGTKQTEGGGKTARNMKGANTMNINEITMGMTPQEKEIYFAHQEKRHREEAEKNRAGKGTVKSIQRKFNCRHYEAQSQCRL